MAIQGELVGKYLTGCDIPIQECNIIVTQPKVRDILQFGENIFFMAINLFAQIDNMFEEVAQEESNLKLLNSFQFFLLLYKEEASIRQQIEVFSELVFPTYEVQVTDTSIDFLQQEQEKKVVKGRVNPFNFDNFKQVIKDLFLPYSASSESYNPKSEKARQIAEKLKKGKEKVSSQKGESDNSLLGSYISILSVGLKMNIYTLLNYKPFQLYDIFSRYSKKLKADEYFAISTVPFVDTSNIEAPDDWTTNLYK